MTTSPKINLSREKRILDVAAELFVHFGFDKTTVSDIAREAGVSKGAIYLHFSSKDDLIEGLIIRELQVYSERWLALIDEDPDGGTMSGMYKNSLLALNESPFMGAIFKRDHRTLGNYLRKEGNIFQKMGEGQAVTPRQQFVQMMQAVGAMRSDIDASVIAHIMDILAYGMIGMDDVIPAAQIPEIDALIEGIAKMMDRALAPEQPYDREAGKKIIREIANTSRERFETLDEQGTEA